MRPETRRYGMTIPLSNVRLHQHRDVFRRLVDSGYTDVWSAESSAGDGFTPLALAAAWAPELRLGTAIVPAFTRGPALLAQSAASMADAAPGRFVMGVGSSSNVIVERWNDIPFEQPYQKCRDVIRFLKAAMGGDKVTETYDTFDIKGFRLDLVPEEPPPIVLAALRGGMLRLAGREADGAITNWLSADDVSTVSAIVHEAAPTLADGTGAEREMVARLFVCPSTNAEEVRAKARFAIAAYLNVPVYAEFHRWLGRDESLGGMWDAWQAGDRKAALAAIPDSVVDELFIHGSPDECRDHIERYRENGIDTPVLTVFDFGGVDPVAAIEDLAPR